MDSIDCGEGSARADRAHGAPGPRISQARERSRLSALPIFCEESGVNSENPWLGLASFTEEQSGYFFGRDGEIAELFRLLKRETLTVLFGQSGLGKTSLLQAGLFPQ